MSDRSRKVALGLSIAIAAGAAAAPADGRIVQRLNYESGNLRQWSAVQALPNRAAVVRRPRRQGRFAARFVVRPGDDPINATGERAEVMAFTNEAEGTNSWWAWSTRFPQGFRPNPGSRWNVFTQWHQLGDLFCPPPVQFVVDSTGRRARIVLLVRGGSVNPLTCNNDPERRFVLAPLRRGRWYDFRFHVRWSSDPRVGLVAVWLNGRRVVRRTPLATLYPGTPVYVKQGFYRAESGLSTVVFHDGMRRFSP